MAIRTMNPLAKRSDACFAWDSTVDLLLIRLRRYTGAGAPKHGAIRYKKQN